MKDEEDKLFDDFLRKSLENYQVKPSPAIWKGILQKIPGRRIGRLPFSGGNSGLIGIISGGILITSVAIYNYNSNKQQKSLSQNSSGMLSAQIINHNIKDSVIYPSTYYLNPFTSKPSENIPSLPSHHENEKLNHAAFTDIIEKVIPNRENPPVTQSFFDNSRNENKSISSPETNAMDDAVTYLSSLDVNTVAEETVTPPLLAMNQNNRNDLNELKALFSNKSSFFNLANKISRQDEMMLGPLRQDPRVFKVTKWKGDYAGNSNTLFFGIYYHPEWLNNPGGSNYNKTRESAGLSLGWKKAPFSLETGLGLMTEKALQNYEIHYHKFLGTYNNLQYILFDTVSGQVVPNYFYSLDSVFDPQEKTQQQSILAQYTYLQVPLIGGLEKSLGRITFSVKAGPVFSFMITKNDHGFDRNPEQRILNVDGDHPDRLAMNIQWYLGASCSYAVTENLSCFIEPAVRGYFGTPYVRKRIPDENPLYYGFRTGVIVQFSNLFPR